MVKFVHELCQPVRNRHLIQRPLRICLENPNKPHLECVGSGQNRAKISYLTLLSRKLQAIKNPPSFFPHKFYRKTGFREGFFSDSQ